MQVSGLLANPVYKKEGYNRKKKKKKKKNNKAARAHRVLGDIVRVDADGTLCRT